MTTTDAAISAELMIEFHSAGQKFTAGSFTTVVALARKLPPGHHEKSWSLIVVESPDPMRNDQ